MYAHMLRFKLKQAIAEYIIPETQGLMQDDVFTGVQFANQRKARVFKIKLHSFLFPIHLDRKWTIQRET